MEEANELVARAAAELVARNGVSDPNVAERPPIFKFVGIILAVASGAFIGVSFVLKKFGLLKANEKYKEEAGEGYGYLKNVWWWSGMTLMIIGEICNFVAYAFTDAILVTPLGALSVVISTILSAIFLKERLSLVGKVGCFLCIVGSTVIVLNAPESSAVATIQQMQGFVIAPGFLTYAGVIIVGSVIAAFYAGPRWGKKNMLVYISICSWVGGLSVVAIQGLGAAVIAQAGGTPQFNQWFLYVLLVFVIGTLVTEIIFLNKALNLFNAAMVTPTYFVYFTTATIISSIVLFRGFKGTPIQIITLVLGFFTICSGVVLLQLSKSAKDVPDTAVFKGDLDQIQTIAEQEQPETEPKADAIRGTAAIVRRLSQARQQRELEELRRLHEEKRMDQLEPVSEDGRPIYEWDGLRRRRTVLFSDGAGNLGSGRRARSATSPAPFGAFAEPERTPHPPLGMSQFPTDDDEHDEHERHGSSGGPGILGSIAGTIRSRARSVVSPTRGAFPSDQKMQSPMHPVPLTEISVPSQKGGKTGGYEQAYGLGLNGGSMGYKGAAGALQHPTSSSSSLQPPASPPRSASRQFSFQNLFKRHQQHGDEEHGGPSSSGHGGLHAHGWDNKNRRQSGMNRRPVGGGRGYSSPLVKGATEEERLGLVVGDSKSMPQLPHYEDDDYSDDDTLLDEEKRKPLATAAVEARYGRGITTPPRRGSDPRDDGDEDVAEYEANRRRFQESKSSSNRSTPTPSQPPPAAGRGGGVSGSFI